MVEWHHRLNGHGFGWIPGVGDGQGGWRAVVHGVAKSRTQLGGRAALACPLPSAGFSYGPGQALCHTGAVALLSPV